MADDYIWPVSYTTNIKEMAKTNAVAFGDGYEQVSPNGINSLPITVTVVHDNISDATVVAILTLLRARKGVTYFRWTPPVPGYNTERKFRCDQWNVQPLQYNANNLSADFREVFDP
jgi:phage-related protein